MFKNEEANNQETKEKIINFLNISYDEKIYTATLGSKIWIGDTLSKEKSLKGEYMKSVTDNDWKLFFSGKDLILLNEIFKDYKRFGYEIFTLKWPKKILFFFYIFTRMSFEKKTFEKIKNKNFHDIIFKLFFIYKKNSIFFIYIF